MPGTRPLEVVPGELQTERGVTARAIVIGFLCIVPAVFWGVYGDVVSQTDLTSTTLMMPPILILSGLVALNALVRRVRPRWVLTQSEMLTVYAMLTVSVVISGMGMLQFLCTSLGAVPHYRTPENGWDRYLGYVPSYIMPRLSAIEGFYKGGQSVPWSAWTGPLIFWSIFVFAMLLAMVSINTMLRKQWVERERLTFPIVMLPVEMTEPGTRFFRNRMMWAGFLLATGLECLNSISFLYPSVPHVQLKAVDIGPAFANPPWNAVGYLATTFYPLAVGLAFIVPTDVSFSCWFFFLLTKVEAVLAAATGWTGGAGSTVSTPPYIGQQGTGAVIGLGLSVLFLARKHLKDVFLKALTGGSRVDDTKEPMSYRGALAGLLAGFAVMSACCVLVGVPVIYAAAYLALYLLFATSITRLRAVAGPPWTEEPDVNALDTLIRPLGAGMFSAQAMIALSYFNWFSIEMRCCPMPQSMEAMKMADTLRLRQRALTVLMLLAIVVGIGVGFWACLAVWYSYGAASAKVESWRTVMGRLPFDRATGYLQGSGAADVAGTIAMGFGAVVVLALGAIRSRFVGFPLHPAGYLLGNTASMIWLWMPFLVAWTAKTLIVRYGGIKGYHTALPFFLGLVLGDFVTSSLWALAGSALGVTMYRCFPC